MRGKIILPHLGQCIMRSLTSCSSGVPQRPQNLVSRYQQHRCHALTAAKAISFGCSVRKILMSR